MKPESQHMNQSLLFNIQKNLGTESLGVSVLKALDPGHVWLCECVAPCVPRGKLDVQQRTGSPAFRKP